MRELADLEVDHDEAFKQIIVKDQIDKKMLGFGGDPELPADERKSFAQFQQKTLQIADDRFFKLRLGESGRHRKAEKFKHIGIFDVIVARWSQRAYALSRLGQLAAGSQQTLIIERVDIAFELASWT